MNDPAAGEKESGSIAISHKDYQDFVALKALDKSTAFALTAAAEQLREKDAAMEKLQKENERLWRERETLSLMDDTKQGDEIKAMQAENKRLSERLAAAERLINSYHGFIEQRDYMADRRTVLMNHPDGWRASTGLRSQESHESLQDDVGNVIVFNDWYAAYQAAVAANWLQPADAEQQPTPAQPKEHDHE